MPLRVYLFIACETHHHAIGKKDKPDRVNTFALLLEKHAAAMRVNLLLF